MPIPRLAPVTSACMVSPSFSAVVSCIMPQPAPIVLFVVVRVGDAPDRVRAGTVRRDEVMDPMDDVRADVADYDEFDALQGYAEWSGVPWTGPPVVGTPIGGGRRTPREHVAVG